MATGNGHDAVTVQMVDILHKIHLELVGVRAVVGELRADVKATNERLDTLHDDVVDLRADVHEIRHDLAGFKEETRGALADIRADVHAIRGELIDTRGDHAARLARLEEAVFKKAG